MGHTESRQNKSNILNCFKMIKPTIHPIKLLIIICLSLSVIRIFLEWEMVYLFLVWNLFLAWLPLFFAQLSSKTNKSYASISLIGLSVLFLPNASYLVTDLVHFRMGSRINLWFDMVLFLSYAFSGLMLTIYTIDALVRVIANMYSKRLSSAFHILIFPIIGCGIYVGRIERWNSWDVFIHPFHFLSEMYQIIFSSQIVDLLSFCALFGGFSALFYILIKRIQQPHDVHINPKLK